RLRRGPIALGSISYRAPTVRSRQFMEADLQAMSVTLVGGVALAAVFIQAGAASAQVELGAAPSVELVAQECTWGYHRNRWRDQWSHWHSGPCVANWPWLLIVSSSSA